MISYPKVVRCHFYYGWINYHGSKVPMMWPRFAFRKIVIASKRKNKNSYDWR